jgi:hypothetical protein
LEFGFLVSSFPHADFRFNKFFFSLLSEKTIDECCAGWSERSGMSLHFRMKNGARRQSWLDEAGLKLVSLIPPKEEAGYFQEIGVEAFHISPRRQQFPDISSPV